MKGAKEVRIHQVWATAGLEKELLPVGNRTIIDLMNGQGIHFIRADGVVLGKKRGILLCGEMNSGKTTLARLLAREYKGQHILGSSLSPDSEFALLVRDGEYARAFPLSKEVDEKTYNNGFMVTHIAQVLPYKGNTCTIETPSEEELTELSSYLGAVRLRSDDILSEFELLVMGRIAGEFSPAMERCNIKYARVTVPVDAPEIGAKSIIDLMQ